MITSKIPLLTRNLQQIALLLTSPKFEETSQFYLKISQIVAKVNLGSVHSPTHNKVKMMFTPSSHPSTGFVFFTKSSSTQDLFHDPDGRPIRLCSDDSALLGHTLSLPEDPVAILRSSCIETIKKYYEQFHECVEEQHGSGPRHYSISWDNGPTTEIYPKRKTCLGNVEFLFQSSNIQLTAQEIDMHGLLPVSTGDRAITLKDPDGRFVNILSF